MFDNFTNTLSSFRYFQKYKIQPNDVEVNQIFQLQKFQILAVPFCFF